MPYQLLFSSVSASVKIKTNQQTMMRILDVKKIEVKMLDLAGDDPDAKRLKEKVAAMDLPTVPPILFLDEEYLGNFEDIDDANERGSLDTFLRL